MVYKDKRSDGSTRLTGQQFRPIDAWPIGSVFLGMTSANPETLLGGGTWTKFSEGRMLVGQTPLEIEFDTAGETGGAKTHTLTLAEMPIHDHAAGSLAADTGGGHDHPINRRGAAGTTGGVAMGSGTLQADGATGNGGGHGHAMSGTTGTRGSGSPHNNMPPYTVVYMWRRTA